jgi:hypothetical protein
VGEYPAAAAITLAGATVVAARARMLRQQSTWAGMAAFAALTVAADNLLIWAGVYGYRDRYHCGLGMRTPMEYEMLHPTAQPVARSHQLDSMESRGTSAQQTQCRSLETQDDGDTLRGGLSHPSTHRPTEVEGGAGPCPAAADGQQPLAEKPGEARENRNGSSACSGVHSGFYLGVSHPLPQDLLSRTTSQWLVVGSDKEELIGRVTARRRSQEAQTTDCQQLVSKRTARLTTRQQGAGRNIASELVLCCGTRGPVLSRVDGPIRSHGRGRRFETFRAHQETTGQTRCSGCSAMSWGRCAAPATTSSRRR